MCIRSWNRSSSGSCDRRGFTLVELLVTVGIIGVLALIVTVAVLPARLRARDGIRVAQLNLLGRFLLANACYLPAAGEGDYDLKTLYDEAAAAHPELKQALPSVPKDPRLGSELESGFRYVYDDAGACALYANLENPDAAVTLPGLSAPTPGGGSGTLRASSAGPNGTDRYYQVAR